MPLQWIYGHEVQCVPACIEMFLSFLYYLMKFCEVKHVINNIGKMKCTDWIWFSTSFLTLVSECKAGFIIFFHGNLKLWFERESRVIDGTACWAVKNKASLEEHRLCESSSCLCLQPQLKWILIILTTLSESRECSRFHRWLDDLFNIQAPAASDVKIPICCCFLNNGNVNSGVYFSIKWWRCDLSAP